MSQVTVAINGRQYRMACEDGQEDHLRQLCADLDRRIDDLRGKVGEIGDARLIVMAALTIADELFEAGTRIGKLEQELATLRNARSSATDRSQATQAAIVEAFNTAAARIEALSKQLNQGIGSGVVVG
jgi:cell division protein ZapA